MSVAGYVTASESEPGTMDWTCVATAPMMPWPGGSVLARATIMWRGAQVVFVEAVEFEELVVLEFVALVEGKGRVERLRLGNWEGDDAEVRVRLMQRRRREVGCMVGC